MATADSVDGVDVDAVDAAAPLLPDDSPLESPLAVEDGTDPDAVDGTMRMIIVLLTIVDDAFRTQISSVRRSHHYVGAEEFVNEIRSRLDMGEAFNSTKNTKRKCQFWALNSVDTKIRREFKAAFLCKFVNNTSGKNTLTEQRKDREKVGHHKM